MYALHIGVKPKNLKAVIQKLRTKGFTYHIDGDGWEVWGEAPGTDMNDKNTLHVVVVIEEGKGHRQKALTLAKHLSSDLKTAKAYVGLDYKAVLTDYSNWGSYKGVEGDVPFYI